MEDIYIMMELEAIGTGLITAGLFLCLSSMARNIGSLLSIRNEVKLIKKANLVTNGKATLSFSSDHQTQKGFISTLNTECLKEINRHNSAMIDRIIEFGFGVFLIGFYGLFLDDDGAFFFLLTLILLGLMALFWVINHFTYDRDMDELKSLNILQGEDIIVPLPPEENKASEQKPIA